MTCTLKACVKKANFHLAVKIVGCHNILQTGHPNRRIMLLWFKLCLNAEGIAFLHFLKDECVHVTKKMKILPQN